MELQFRKLSKRASVGIACCNRGMEATELCAWANFSELLGTTNTTVPKLGTAPSSVQIIDPNWANPLIADEMNELFGFETGLPN